MALKADLSRVCALPAQQCPGQQQAFALPCRQGVDAARCKRCEADGLEALRDGRGETVPTKSGGGCEEFQALINANGRPGW